MMKMVEGFVKPTTSGYAAGLRIVGTDEVYKNTEETSKKAWRWLYDKMRELAKEHGTLKLVDLMRKKEEK